MKGGPIRTAPFRVIPPQFRPPSETEADLPNFVGPQARPTRADESAVAERPPVKSVPDAQRRTGGLVAAGHRRRSAATSLRRNGVTSYMTHRVPVSLQCHVSWPTHRGSRATQAVKENPLCGCRCRFVSLALRGYGHRAQCAYRGVIHLHERSSAVLDPC